MDVAKRVLEWPCLLIDEVSKVSALIVTDMHVNLREVVRDLDLQNAGLYHVTRPYGGLNVFCCCDLWQLGPPDGGL